MNSAELQVTPIDSLIVGFQGLPVELIAAINLCRRYGGKMISREKDVMVIEIGSDPEAIDELLTKLPRGVVTHLWRSGGATISRKQASGQITNFCSV